MKTASDALIQHVRQGPVKPATMPAMRLVLALLIALTTASETSQVRGKVELRLGKRRLAVASVTAAFPHPLTPCPLTLRITTRDRRVPGVVIALDNIYGGRGSTVGHGARLELTVAGRDGAVAASAGGVELSLARQLLSGKLEADFGELGQLRGSFRLPELGCLWDLE